MVAVCGACEAKSGGGWYWSHARGYGDFDIKCSLCGEVLHQRGEEYVESDAPAQ